MTFCKRMAHGWKEFSTLKVTKHWPRLPTEVVDAPFPAKFEVRLNGEQPDPAEDVPAGRLD